VGDQIVPENVRLPGCRLPARWTSLPTPGNCTWVKLKRDMEEFRRVETDVQTTSTVRICSVSGMHFIDRWTQMPPGKSWGGK